MFAMDLDDSAQLRQLEPWQAQEFLAHIDRARETVDPWIPWATLSTDLPSARATLQRYADRTAQDTARLYGIWLNGVLVGGTMFVKLDATSGNCEIGCWLEPAGTGRGLITKSARRLLDWAFEVRGLHRAEWRCRPDNTASIAVARRLGMTHEGTLRAEFPYLGVRHDGQIWAITAPEWSAGR